MAWSVQAGSGAFAEKPGRGGPGVPPSLGIWVSARPPQAQLSLWKDALDALGGPAGTLQSYSTASAK